LFFVHKKRFLALSIRAMSINSEHLQESVI